MATQQENDRGTDRLAGIFAEVQSIRAGPSTDNAAIRRRSMLYTEMLDLQRSFLRHSESSPAPEQASLHDKLYLHLADEQITDAEALLAFRRRLQLSFYPNYADTLSVQVLLADLSEIRRNYVRDWVEREETLGRYLSIDKEWLGYRLAHAEIHFQRVQAELHDAERASEPWAPVGSTRPLERRLPTNVASQRSGTVSSSQDRWADDGGNAL